MQQGVLRVGAAAATFSHLQYVQTLALIMLAGNFRKFSRFFRVFLARSIEELADRSMHIIGMVMLMGALAAATHTVQSRTKPLL